MKKLLVILVCAFALSSCGSSKKEVQPPADKQGATKARLIELFQLCKDDKNSEAAAYMLYTGYNKKRANKEVMRYEDEPEKVNEVCRNIKTNLLQSDRYEFEQFSVRPANDVGPEVAVWLVAFHAGGRAVRWSYLSTFLDGKYVLAADPFPASVPISVPTPPDKSSTSTPSGPVSAGILNDKATHLPQPAYPALARSSGAAGEVRVAVTVDENGNVIQASPISGHPLLRGTAVAAARNAKFEPTKIDGRPVQVKGILKYQFVAP